ncbi:MAG: hypothetical protein NUV52_03125 [Candidatus Roizmanbacteria bacterium]|nr:hypothetical protein [Candidatus Roizmanbacteria bacterium]
MGRESSLVEKIKLGVVGLSTVGQLIGPPLPAQAESFDTPAAIEQKIPLDINRSLGFDPLEFSNSEQIYYINADDTQGVDSASRYISGDIYTIEDHPLFPNVNVNSTVGNWSFSQGIQIDRETLDDPLVWDLVSELELEVKQKLDIDPRIGLQNDKTAIEVMRVMADYIAQKYPNTDEPYGNENNTIPERIKEEHVCFDRVVMLNLGLSAFGFNATAVASFYTNIHGFNGYNGETAAHAVSLAEVTDAEGVSRILILDPTGTRGSFTVLNINQGHVVQTVNPEQKTIISDIFVGDYQNYPKPMTGPIWIDNFTVDGLIGEDLKEDLGAQEYKKTVRVDSNFDVVSLPNETSNASSVVNLPWIYKRTAFSDEMCKMHQSSPKKTIVAE